MPMGWYFVAKVIQSVLLASYICCLRAGVLFWSKSNLQGVYPPKSAPNIVILVADTTGIPSIEYLKTEKLTNKANRKVKPY